MAFTHDATTDRGKVRLLCRDTVEATAIFTDDEIDAFLSIHDSDVKLAAAEALDTVASNQALLLKKVKLGDIGTDGPAVAAALRAHADRLRAQSVSEVDFDFAEMNFNGWSANTILNNSALRGL